MICSCGEEMRGEFVDDNPNAQPCYAYNVFNCGGCGMIAKQSVWNNPGVLWISALDVVTRWATRVGDRRQEFTPPGDRHSGQFRRGTFLPHLLSGGRRKVVDDG